LQTGTYTVAEHLGQISPYGVFATGPATRLIFASDAFDLYPSIGVGLSNGAFASLANGIALRLTGLAITDGTFDIGTGTLSVGALPQQVRGWIASGLAGGYGITSSAADAAHGVGYAMSGSALQLKRTLYGDTNLDGTVDFTDLLNLAQHYGQTNAVWSEGDFNYDGTVNFADLLALGQNFGKPLTAAASLLARRAVSPRLLRA